MNWLVRQLEIRPDSVAIRFEGATVTWSELVLRTQRISAALQLAGVRPGARVATLVRNGIDHVCLLHAAMWSGSTLVPLDPNALDGVVSHQLRDSSADILVVDRNAANRSLDLGPVRFVQIEELTYSLSVDAVPFRSGAEATILYPAEERGDPRPVRLTWRNYEAGAIADALTLGVRPDDDWLCCLPLSSAAGVAMTVRSVIYGSPMTVLDSFEEEAVLRAIDDGSTIVSLIPSMLVKLAEYAGGFPALAERLSASSLRAILLGGGRVPVETIADAIMAGLPVYRTWGMPETGSQIATVPPDRAAEKIGSVGFPLWGAEIQIRDDRGEPVTSGAGVIWVRGPMVSAGYLDRPDLNRTHFVGGWFRTRDRGHLDEDGFLWLENRPEEVIVSGGEGVAAEEVEQILLGHPQIREVAIFGVDDPRAGQRVTAAIVTDGSVSSDDLDAFARARLAPHQRPRAWVVVSELPRTEGGALRRQLLRARYG